MRLLVLLPLLGLLTSGCNEECEVVELVSPKLCLPRVAGAGVPLQFEAADDCTNCFDRGINCSTRVRAGVVEVTLEKDHCVEKGVACPAVCGIDSTNCLIEPLAEGDYEVRLNGEHLGTLAVLEEGFDACMIRRRNNTNYTVR